MSFNLIAYIKYGGWVGGGGRGEGRQKEEQMVRRQYELETEVQDLLTVINQQKLTIDELYEKLESGTLQSESY